VFIVTAVTYYLRQLGDYHDPDDRHSISSTLDGSGVYRN
jgi:hypothetical protein